MVGVNLYTHRFGTVAIFATLFAAIHVTLGEKGCIFDFENVSDFDLKCNEKNSWTVNEDAADSPNKKILILSPEQDGCFKTKTPITLNATSPVTLRFFTNGVNENGKFVLRLLPKDGNCPDEECVWNVGSDPQFKVGEWVTAEYKFPLKSQKEYLVQLQAGKSKGKFLVDRIAFPSAYGDSYRCHSDSEGVRAVEEAGMNKVNLPNQFVMVEGEGGAGEGGGEGGKGSSPGLLELSKNLMLTSASILILNNILN